MTFQGFVTRVTRRMPHSEQELLTLPDHPSTSPGFSVFVLFDLYFSVRFLFVILSLFFWSLYYMSFDLRLWLLNFKN